MKILPLLLVLLLITPFVRSQTFDPTMFEIEKNFVYSEIIPCDNGESIIIIQSDFEHGFNHVYSLIKLDKNLETQWKLEIKMKGTASLTKHIAFDKSGNTVYALNTYDKKVTKYYNGKDVSETTYKYPKKVFFKDMYITVDGELILLFDKFNGGFKKLSFDNNMNYTIVESEISPINHLVSESTAYYQYHHVKLGDDFFLFETLTEKDDEKAPVFEMGARKFTKNNELSYVKKTPEFPIHSSKYRWFTEFKVDEINKQLYVAYLLEDKNTLIVEAYDYDLNILWNQSLTLERDDYLKNSNDFKHVSIMTFKDKLIINLPGVDHYEHCSNYFFDSKSGEYLADKNNYYDKNVYSDYMFNNFKALSYLDHFYNDIFKTVSEIASDKKQYIEIVPMKSSDLLVIYDKKTVSLQVLGK
jgi:hypothetical protein